jgi:hypothetical protein
LQKKGENERKNNKLPLYCREFTSKISGDNEKKCPQKTDAPSCKDTVTNEGFTT